MPQYEYLVRTILVMGKPGSMISDSLNHYGLEGWELVSVAPGQGRVFVFFFKRRLRDADEDSMLIANDVTQLSLRQAEAPAPRIV